MAEGVLGGLLGGEEQPEEIEKAAETASAEAILGADAFAAAIAVNQAGYGPEVAAETASFLRAQRELLGHQVQVLQTQIHHLHDEHHLRISMMRGQRAGLRIRVLLQALTAVISLTVAAGLCTMIFDAFTSRAVVVDDFNAPPALAARGLSGRVLAAGILDTLDKLQAATRSPDASLSTVSAWSSDIKLEVPDTGLSVGEIDKLLHARLGHDVHIAGELQQGKDGSLRLTVRGAGIAAKSFAGADGALDSLVTQAAEYAYGQSQPLQYARYLTDIGRDSDLLAILPGVFAHARDDRERAAFANVWGIAYGDLNKYVEAERKFRLALTLLPNNWKAWTNLVANAFGVGGEEAQWREATAYLKAAASAPARDRPELRMLSNPAEATWDLPLELAGFLDDARYSGGSGTSARSTNDPALADLYGMLHDWPQAERYLTAGEPGAPLTNASTQMLQAYRAIDRNEPEAAAAPLVAFWKAWQADPTLQPIYPDYPCLTGFAAGMAGHLADAEAIFKRLGAWSRCAAFHGDVLAHAGDQAGADHVWTEGLAVAPDLPWIYIERARNEAGRGDYAAADADFATAHEKATHFADPLKYWGDALAARGKWPDALAKYEEALKYAPNWVELHEAAGTAKKHVS